MIIRSYQPQDEVAQVAIYNEAAADLPKFKPATVDEVARRFQAADFVPGTHFYAEDGGRVVGYAAFHANGRVSYPWCRKGHEGLAEPLFQTVLKAMTQRGQRLAFAAYRGDWPAQLAFFQDHGFRVAREMVNFVLDLADMPTPAARPSSPIAPLRPEDLPAVLKLFPGVLRVRSEAELARHLFHNPYFGADSVFAVRGRADRTPIAVGVLVENPAYADPKAVDAAMPCFRLGAFGTEGMQTKRLNGLFSFLTRPDNMANPLAIDLMGHAAYRLRHTEVTCLAAQVPSDAPHLLRFYQETFRKQGSFPILERELVPTREPGPERISE
jgi:hypothetical protein